MSFPSSNENLLTRVRIERERRRRQRVTVVPTRPPWAAADFAANTFIERPHGATVARVPFVLWPAQRDVLARMDAERLLVILKARQLGISWLACLYALSECTGVPSRTVLLFSQGQLEANELIRRIGFMYTQHAERRRLPTLRTDNMAELTWSNGSRIISLPATKRAGRSFTASLVILDEFAFMQYRRELFTAVKPTIDGGGKLFVISSADGQGSEYHQFWRHAEEGTNTFTPVFLPWTAHPERGSDWRDQRLLEAMGDTSEVYREYPENPIEAFTHAAGLIYAVWSEEGNVTEAADYVPGAGPVYWACDDGYSGGSAPNTHGIDPKLGSYVADAHPRVFLLCQQKPDGHLDVFYENYACLRLSDEHIADVLAEPYPAPEFAAHGPGFAELRGRLYAASIYPRQGTSAVDEGIKEVRRALAADGNGWRRVRVHPRCKQLRLEMASYRYDEGTEKPVKAHDHGPDALRYVLWALRHDQ